jgi:hypothetical protein
MSDKGKIDFVNFLKSIFSCLTNAIKKAISI